MSTSVRETSIHEKYAQLLVNYCLAVKPNDKVYITSSYLAESLLQEVVKSVYIAGGVPVLSIEMKGINELALKYGEAEQLSWVSPMKKYIMENFDCYLNIRAPFERGDDEKEPFSEEKFKIQQKANQEINNIYFERIGNGSMRRCLCQFPTRAGADDAELSLEEYEKFVYQSCYLFDADPVAKWLEVRKKQQVYVDYLNKADLVQYKGPNIDISFSVKGRTWINSDGRSNMPSGEVFSAPIEDSVNGKVYFSYPTIYMGKDVVGITLEVKDGEVVKWDAEQGKEILDKVFAIDGARNWGEVAIGTNYNIQRTTRNILFDEKIGGSIHMAVGQSYKQCGGKNESTVHWDMITDMKKGGQIIVDGVKIYENGEFLI
ncbi:MAG: peptidase aminopeptidase [Bacteroidota bacterium]|nr:peptidase aminopeptidase [Bacteroidota bacterium]